MSASNVVATSSSAHYNSAARQRFALASILARIQKPRGCDLFMIGDTNDSEHNPAA
jgi:hypothetical protein